MKTFTFALVLIAIWLVGNIPIYLIAMSMPNTALKTMVQIAHLVYFFGFPVWCYRTWFKTKDQ